MADATTISRFTHAQEKPQFCMSHIFRRSSLPPGVFLVPNTRTSKLIPKHNLQFQHSSSPLLIRLVSSNRQGSRGRGGLAWTPTVHASSRATSRVDNSDNDLPPLSKEETVEQAGSSLVMLLEKTLKQHGPTTVKQRKSQRQVRLRVDIPLLEDSPEALITLADDLVDSFLKGIRCKVAVYFSDSALRDAAAPRPPGTYHSLDGSENLPKDAVVAFVIAPRFQQTASLASVAKSADVRPVIVVNPEWSEEEEVDKILGAFLTSFCVAYSFIPLNIQGFFSKTEGAVLKRARSGSPDGQPWLIYVKEGESYKCVSRLKKRPTPTDLENALYSSMAANSPVNKSIAFLRGLVSK